MNAMSDDSPKPTKAWEMPDENTLKEFVAREVCVFVYVCVYACF